MINTWPLAKLRRFLRKGRCLSGDARIGRRAPAQVLRPSLHRGRPGPPRPGPGPAERRAATGSRPGSWRPRRTSHTIPRATRTEGGRTQRRDVRAAGPPLRVFHVRHALLHERRDRRRQGRAWRCSSGRPSRSRALDMMRGGAGAASASRAVFGTGASSARRSGSDRLVRRRRSRSRPRPVDRGGNAGRRETASVRVRGWGSSVGTEHAWRFSVGGEPFVSPRATGRAG